MWVVECPRHVQGLAFRSPLKCRCEAVSQLAAVPLMVVVVVVVVVVVEFAVVEFVVEFVVGGVGLRAVVVVDAGASGHSGTGAPASGPSGARSLPPSLRVRGDAMRPTQHSQPTLLKTPPRAVCWTQSCFQCSPKRC